MNDNVTLPISSSFSFGTGNFTVESWIKTTKIGGIEIAIGAQQTGDFWLGVNEGKAHFSISGSGVTSTVSVNDGLWHHIAGVRNSSSIYLYVDGNLAATVANGSNISFNSAPVHIGNFIGGYFFQGTIDEVRIWNIARSASDIANNMITVSPQTGLIAYYKFDQGVANADNTGISTLTDASGSGFNGTLDGLFALSGTSSNWVQGISAPNISTAAATKIEDITATIGGNITLDGGFSVTARGVCWSTNSNPSLNATNFTTDGTGTGSFTSLITGLTAGTTYYARSYASNSTGTYYGAQVSFIYTNVDIILTALANPTVTDIAVATGTKFTANTNGQTVNSITVQPGGKLDLTNALTVSGDVTLKADNSGSFSANIEAPLTVNGTLNYIKTMDANRWYFMSFPCNVDVNAITQVGGTLGALNTTWYIKEYDGASRIQNLATVSNWKYIIGTTLIANKGYIIALESFKGTQDISFPLDKALVQAAENAVRTISNTVIKAHGDGVTTNLLGQTVGSNHKGWNLVGQPFLSKFSGANASGGTAGSYLTYISVPVGVSGATYSQSVKAAYTDIEPFSAYFVQVDAGIESSGISFATGGRHLAPSAVDSDLSDHVQLNFTTATGTDNTNLVMDNSQTTAYEMNRDLEKMLGTGTAQPQVYTQLGGINYAFNALPAANVNNLPIGFYTKTVTATTISATATAPSLSALLLTDTNNGNVTDLLASSYTFTPTASGTNNTRFTISAKRITTEKVVATEKDGPTLSITQIAIGAKLIINNLSGVTTVRVYDAIGRMLLSKTTGDDAIEIKVVTSGIYTVQMQCGDKSWTKKIVAH